MSWTGATLGWWAGAWFSVPPGAGANEGVPAASTTCLWIQATSGGLELEASSSGLLVAAISIPAAVVCESSEWLALAGSRCFSVAASVSVASIVASSRAAEARSAKEPAWTSAESSPARITAQ